MIQRAWVAFVTAISVLSLWAHCRIGLNNDNQLLLDQTKKLMDGATPYVDYVDPNPPMIHLLLMAPVAFSRLTGASMAFSLTFLTDLLVVAALGVSGLLLTRSDAPANHRSVAIGAISLALLGVAFINQPFGDRDHLLIVLGTPWLVLNSPLVRRDRIAAPWTALIGVSAAIGMCIKPYFWIFFLAVLAWQLIRQRTAARAVLTQPDTIAIVATGAIFAGVVLFAFPHYLTVLPLTLESYGPYRERFAIKLFRVGNEIGLAALPGLIATWIVVRLDGVADRNAEYLLLLLGAATIEYVFNSGWPYTLYPALAFSLLVGIAAVASLVGRGELRAAAVFAALIAWRLAWPAWSRADLDIRFTAASGHPANTTFLLDSVRDTLGAEIDARPRFLLTCTTVWGVNLLKEGTPRIHEGRFDALWPMPAAVLFAADPSKAESAARIRAFLVDGIVDDLSRRKPDLVIDDVSPAQYNLPEGFNALEFLRQSDSFEREWAAFELGRHVDFCDADRDVNCAFDLYYRSSARSP